MRWFGGVDTPATGIATTSGTTLSTFTTTSTRALADMRVVDLKAYAKENNITLSGARNKSDILKAIENAE